MIAPSPPPDWMSPFGEEDEASAAQRQHNTIPHPRSASPLPTAAAALASTAQQEGLVVVNPHPVRTSHHATTQGHAALDAGDDAAALRHTNNIVVAPPHGGGRPASVHTSGAMTITSSGSLLVHGMAPKAFCAMQKPPAQQGAAAARASSSAKPSLLPVGSLPRLPRVVNTMCILTPNRLHPQQPAAAAATPPSVSSSGIAMDTYLAVACSDGSLRVYSLVDMDTCVFADCPASREAINQIVVCQAYMCASCDDHCTYTYQFCGGDALAGSTCNSNGSAGGGSSWQRAHAQPQSSPHPPNRRHPTTAAGLARRASGVSHASPVVGGGLGGSNGSTAALWVPHGKQHHGTAITSIVAYVPRSDASPALTMQQQQGPLSPQRRSHGGGALTSLPLATRALLLVTTYEPDVVIWDVAEGTVYARLQGHTQGVQHCFTSLTTGNIVTCSYDSTVRLWDLATPLQASGGEPTPPQATQERRGRSLQGSIGLDDELVADASDAHSLLCSRHYIEEGVHYGVTAFTHHRKAVLHAVDVAGTRSLCSISRDDTICVWDQLTLEPLCVVSHVPGHQFVACVPFPCLSSVAMLFGDGTCRVYSTTNGKQMYFMNIAIPQSVTKITRTGLLASCSTSGRISVISADTGEVVASDTKLHGLGITCVLPLYDDEGPDAAIVAPLLITGSEDRMVRVSHIQRLGAGGQQRRSLGTAPIGVVNEAVQGNSANQVVVNAC